MRPNASSLIVAFAFIAPSAQAGHENDGKYTVVEIVAPADPECLPGFWRATTARRMNESGEVVGDDICVIATGDETAPAVIGGSDGYTGENFYNDSALCQNTYAFLLTPRRKR